MTKNGKDVTDAKKTVKENDTVVVDAKNSSQVADEVNKGENTMVDDEKNVNPRNIQLKPLLNS